MGVVKPKNKKWDQACKIRRLTQSTVLEMASNKRSHFVLVILKWDQNGTGKRFI